MARSIVRAAALLLLAIGITSPLAAQPVPGRDYVVLDPPQRTSDPERIVVTEFFSYQCPHCFAFHPALEAWRRTLADDVTFERAAVSIGRSAWAPAARAFFALRSMDQLDELDSALFDAIHVEGARLFDEAAITRWVGEHGVDAERFAAMYAAYGTITQTARAEQLAQAQRIPGVPTLVIDGRYVVSISSARAFDAQLETVDRLIVQARERKARAD